MNREDFLNKAQEYVKQELGNDPSGHDWWHIYRVTQLAKKIAKEEKADEFICETAALLHDLADEKLAGSKEIGLMKVGSWLDENGIEQAVKARVLEIIATMSYRGGSGSKMTSLEGMIVQDADRLDAMGVIGIARTFVYAGWKGDLIYDPNLPYRNEMSIESYRNERSTAINHFHEKLLKLKDLINTDYAKKLAEERHERLEEFLRQFYREWNADELE